MTQQTQQHNTTKNITITDRFEFRDIHAEEADRAVAIEQICFPPHEACSGLCTCKGRRLGRKSYRFA